LITIFTGFRYYNADDRRCVPFQYSGRLGNQNNFLTEAECDDSCPRLLCMLSVDRGTCTGRLTRYAFDRQRVRRVRMGRNNFMGIKIKHN
jgi:hypothetical protein